MFLEKNTRRSLGKKLPNEQRIKLLEQTLLKFPERLFEKFLWEILVELSVEYLVVFIEQL